MIELFVIAHCGHWGAYQASPVAYPTIERCERAAVMVAGIACARAPLLEPREIRFQCGDGPWRTVLIDHRIGLAEVE
jgi:hypothetical protein